MRLTYCIPPKLNVGACFMDALKLNPVDCCGTCWANGLEVLPELLAANMELDTDEPNGVDAQLLAADAPKIDATDAGAPKAEVVVVAGAPKMELVVTGGAPKIAAAVLGGAPNADNLKFVAEVAGAPKIDTWLFGAAPKIEELDTGWFPKIELVVTGGAPNVPDVVCAPKIEVDVVGAAKVCAVTFTLPIENGFWFGVFPKIDGWDDDAKLKADACVAGIGTLPDWRPLLSTCCPNFEDIVVDVNTGVENTFWNATEVLAPLPDCSLFLKPLKDERWVKLDVRVLVDCPKMLGVVVLGWFDWDACCWLTEFLASIPKLNVGVGELKPVLEFDVFCIPNEKAPGFAACSLPEMLFKVVAVFPWEVLGVDIAANATAVLLFAEAMDEAILGSGNEIVAFNCTLVLESVEEQTEDVSFKSFKPTESPAFIGCAVVLLFVALLTVLVNDKDVALSVFAAAKSPVNVGAVLITPPMLTVELNVKDEEVVPTTLFSSDLGTPNENADADEVNVGVTGFPKVAAMLWGGAGVTVFERLLPTSGGETELAAANAAIDVTLDTGKGAGSSDFCSCKDATVDEDVSFDTGKTKPVKSELTAGVLEGTILIVGMLIWLVICTSYNFERELLIGLPEATVPAAVSVRLTDSIDCIEDETIPVSVTLVSSKISSTNFADFSCSYR